MTRRPPIEEPSCSRMTNRVSAMCFRGNGGDTAIACSRRPMGPGGLEIAQRSSSGIDLILSAVVRIVCPSMPGRKGAPPRSEAIHSEVRNGQA